jgi:hypothetical protein
MNTIRLTRNAQKWAEEKSVNSEIVTRAKDIEFPIFFVDVTLRCATLNT